MSVEMLTYAALGARLKVSPEAARSLAARLRLPRSRAPDGKALVSVDLAEIRHTPRPPSTRQAGNIALLATRIETLQAEIARLETMVASHRTDFERERERADRLMVELLQTTAETVAAKEATARLEGELAALRTGDRAASAQAQAARRLGHLAASIVEADRKACSNNSGPLIHSSLEQP
jgi:DNA repair exonuclease SbcCD ATPase subunit